MNLVLLPAGVGNLEEISSFAHRLWREYFPGIISSEQVEYMLSRGYSLEVLSDEILEQGISYDRLLMGSDLIGFASYGPARSPGEMKLHKLYLDLRFHGKGYGTKMLKHVESMAADRGFNTIILSVNKNNHRAIASYKQNGFVVRESVVVDIGSGFVMDDYVMVKVLGLDHGAQVGENTPQF